MQTMKPSLVLFYPDALAVAHFTNCSSLANSSINSHCLGIWFMYNIWILQIKHFNLLWTWQIKLVVKWEATKYREVPIWCYWFWSRTRKPTLECWRWSAHIDHQMRKSSPSWSQLKNNKVRGKTCLSMQNAKHMWFWKISFMLKIFRI